MSRVRVGTGVGVCLGILTGVVLVQAAGPDEVARTLALVPWWTLPAVAALQVVALVALTQLWRSVFGAHGGTVGFRDALTISMGVFGLTQVLPGGGAAGGVFAIQRFRGHGADAVRATATALTVGLVSMGTLGVILSVATTVTAVASPVHTRYAVVSVAVTLVLAVQLLVLRWVMASSTARAWLVTRLDGLSWRGRHLGRPLARGLERGGWTHGRLVDLWRPAAWSALNWTFDIAVLALLLHAAGARAPVLAVLVAFAVGNLLNGLPVTPGGIGLVEAGLAGTLIGFGVEAAPVSVAVLAYRACAYWIPAAVAAPIVLAGLSTPAAAAGARA